MVGIQLAFLFDASFRVVAVVGLFGAVLPMVFGMAYLLLPSYVGRTLSSHRLPGLHFVLAYAGTGCLLGYEHFDQGHAFRLWGVFLWSAGIAVFIGTLLRTILPVFLANPGPIRPTNLRAQRSTKLALLAIPLALSYLIVGTLALLSTVNGVPAPFTATFPMIVHLYGAGFVTLLIFALGIRLLTGFFHVTPPRSLSMLVLFCGGLAPGILAFTFYHPPWFTIGAALEFVAITAYTALVVIVAYRTERRRIGLYGIGLGALSAVASIGIALATTIDIIGTPDITAHVVGILDGFLLLTIIGYAYQFFPVTNGQFWGATERTGLATLLVLAAGTGIQLFSALGGLQWLELPGIVLAATGTSGYAYLMVRRVLY